MIAVPTAPLTRTAGARRAAPAPQYASAAWSALGSHVRLAVTEAEHLACARAEAERVLDRMERASSPFRPDSDLVAANSGAGRWVRVHPVLVGLVDAAIWAAEQTDGLVDPTIGGSLAALGYDTDQATPHGRHAAAGTGPTYDPATTASIPLPAVPDAWRAVELDFDGAIRVPAGVRLDLGAVGKAFAADLLAAHVSRHAGTGLVVSVGGDVAVGIDPDAAVRAHPWRVSVGERLAPLTDVGTGPESAVDPAPDASPAEVVMLADGGLATSSTLLRRWRHGDAAVHHLLDPRTGRPVDQCWRTASVLAPSCLEANTASTAAIVLGPAAADWLGARGLPARLVGRDGDVLRITGWPTGPGDDLLG